MASHIPSYDGIRAKLELPETEETWDKISRGLDELKRLVRDDGSDQDPDFLPLLRTVARPLIDAMSSERTRLSGNAISTLSSIAAGLGRQFEPVVHIFFPPLLALCARANKITVSRARKAIADIIEGTLLPSLLTYFLDSSKDKSASLRLACAEGALGCLNSLNPPDLERESRVHQIEALIISAGGDASADVRQLSKKMYAAYCQLLPSRVDEFSSQLSPTIKKTLGVKQTVVAAASLAVPRPKSAAATLRASETKLSSSTSAVPSQRPQTSMSTHVRSASSSSEVTRGGAKPQGSMGPPNFIPSKPSQAPARPTHSRTASKVEEEGPKRPLSIHSVPSRPASASSTRSNGKEPNGTSSLNSSRSGPSRVKSRAIPPAEHDKIVSLARRVPLPDEDTQYHSLVDNAASSSSYSGPRRAPRKVDSDQEAPSRQGMPGQRKPTVPVLEHAKAKEVSTAPKRTIAPVPVSSVAQPTQQPAATARVTPVSKSATSAIVNARTRTVSKPAPPSQKVASSEIIKTKVSTKPPVPKVADLKRTASKPALNSIGEGSKPTSKSRIP
ncbi:clasp N terminal-domain-containing protein [Flagelloscypha sp. PMI_526]|nr:clasp N terminal-domain-containing protein [Flagelloscypha sp. PMI_526]